MDTGTHDGPESALRPLRNAAGVIDSLRAGSLPPEESRGAVVQTAAAVEMTLRRLLRDLPEAALQVRLRALAPDELRADEVLAELRQHDRISIELAAAVHDLFELRGRVRDGAAPDDADATLAYQVAARLEHEVLSPRPAATPAPPDATLPAGDDTLVAPAPRSRRLSNVPPRGVLGAVGLLLLVLVGVGIWRFSGADDSSLLREGIARFRSGSYEDAASFFWRYAEANPDDVTPHVYLARIHRRMRRPDLASDEIRKALDLAPEDASVHAELGLLLLDAGHADEAANRFRTALRFDAESEISWIGLVRSLQAAGRADAAERVLESAPAGVRERVPPGRGDAPAPL